MNLTGDLKLGVSVVRIGDLRHRVTFQSEVTTDDGQGGFSSVWEDLEVLPTVWGYLKPVKAFERNFAAKVEYQKSHTLTIRHRDDLTTSMQVVYDSRIFKIKGIVAPDERKYFLILDLEENVGT